MSEATVTEGTNLQDLIAKIAEFESLQAQVGSLTAEVSELKYKVRTSVTISVARAALVELAEELTGESVPDDLDDDQLTAVNQALENIGADTFEKEFEVEVTPKFIPGNPATITVMAASFDEARDKVENGEFDTEIQDEYGISGFDVEIEDVTEV